MTIQLNCPFCHQAMRLPENALGKRARCPQCNEVIEVPLSLAPVQAGPSSTVTRPTSPANDSFIDLPPLTSTQPASSTRPLANSGSRSPIAPNPYSAAANPYATTSHTYSAPMATDTGASAYGPGLSLMILSGIHLAFILMGLILNIIGWVMMAVDGQGNAVGGGELAVLIGIQLGMNAVAAGIQGTVFMGGKAMMDHRNQGLAYAGAIVSLVPCIGSPLVVLGIPFGIWALVMLGKPEVQRRFH